MASANRDRPDGPGARPQSATAADAADPRLRCSAHLWRDFQKPAPKGGKPLAMTLSVQTEEGAPWPAGWGVSAVTCVHDEGRWQPALRAQPAPAARDSGLRLVFAAHGGPAWPVDSPVEVTVRLHNGAGEEVVVSTTHARIQRVD